MWIYEKKLQYPVKIAKPDARLAGIIVDALGGPDGEVGASMRYLSQRYTMPSGKVIGTLTDIGNEELAHMEIVSALLYQLTKGLSPEEIKAAGLDKYYVNHGSGIYPAAASGEPYTCMAFNSKGDPIADLNEDLAAEQKARVTYDNILRLSDNPDVNDVIKFLRQREIVHYQRFGEALRSLTD
ncbi:MAG: manganese catalase family protein [Clostridia bacterium]|nr:manganese catalase family protein [Clostridia bacterium]